MKSETLKGEQCSSGEKHFDQGRKIPIDWLRQMKLNKQTLFVLMTEWPHWP